MDSNINDKKITGEWYDVSLEKLISTLAYPHDYIIDWKRLSTPLGMLDQVSRITIIGDNNALSLNPILSIKLWMWLKITMVFFMLEMKSLLDLKRDQI